MNILLVLVLTVFVSSSPSFIRTSNRVSGNNKSKKLSDDQILEAISVLLSETQKDDEPLDLPRKGKQVDEGLTEEEEEDEESARQTLGGQEKCEVTGYEMRMREECEEVSETQCTPITLTKYRTEIVNKCQTKLDEKTCKVTFSTIPRQECKPKMSKRCNIEYDIVPETLHKEECHVSVQHVCEEFVPVPVPVHVGYPVEGPPPGYPVGPTPTPQPLFTVTPTFKSIGKRAAEADLDEKQIKEIVREMLRQTSQSEQGMTFPDSAPGLLTSLLQQTEKEASQAALPNLTPIQKTEKLDPSVLGSPLLSLSRKSQPPLVVSPHHPPAPPPGEADHDHPPLVTTYELPQQYPGCRSIATKTCHVMPTKVDKKVPRERCRDVPDVECYNVLKEVPELECIPEPYEECNDVAKEIPYLEPAEECEEIFYDDCIEITESIPVEVCTRKRVDEESIFLSRGKPKRKEGEKRRKKIPGNRKKDEDAESSDL